MNSRLGTQTSFVLGAQWMSIKKKPKTFFIHLYIPAKHMHRKAHTPTHTRVHMQTAAHTPSQTLEEIQGLDSARTPNHFNYNQTNLKRN